MRECKKAEKNYIVIALLTLAVFVLGFNYGIVCRAEGDSDYILSKNNIWYYQVLDENEKTAMLVNMNRSSGVTLSGDASTGTYTIPDEIDGYKVVKLGKDEIASGEDGALSGLKGDSVKIIVIPEGVVSIGEKCFANSGISEVQLPDSLLTIGNNAFHYCQSLETVKFGSGLKEIGENAFLLCGKLGAIELPDSLETIKYKAFQECTSLKSVIIPDSVTSIGEQAFAACSGLVMVTLGEGTEEIGKYAFISCESLKSIVIPDSVTSLGYGAFARCTALGSAVIGEGVTEVAEGAFLECTKLERAVLPDTLESVGKGAFKNCTAMKTITIPKAVKVIGDSAFYGCESLESMELPDGLETIGDGAFKACKNLAEINIPSTVESIGNEAFLTNYITVKNEDSGESNNELIEDAKKLTITISEKLDNVDSLNLTVYGDVVFNVNENNSTVINYFTDNSVTNYITYSNSSTQNGEDPSNEETGGGNGTTGENGNEGGSGTTGENGSEGGSVTTGGNGSEGGSVTSSGSGDGTGSGSASGNGSEGNNGGTDNSTQNSSDSKVEYKVGKTYTSGSCKYKLLSKNTAAFMGVTNKKLTTVKIPATVKFNKKSYKITEIGKNAFKGNKKLKKLTISKNVRKIGAKAFMNCKNLKKMVIKTKSLGSVGKAAFKGVKFGAKGIDITVPKGKKDKYTKLIVKAR